MVLSLTFLLFNLLIFVVEITPDKINGLSNTSVIQLEHGGELQGVTLYSRRGRPYFGYLGIPFGKISERFSIAEAAKPWKGLKVMDTLPPPCVQFDATLNMSIGTEDCLTLNLYTPQVDAVLPVLAWIFPGGFQVSGASSYQAKYFMDEDIVLVSINYRLGAMGFLDSADGTLLGNVGLKDQVLAMQWVKQNINKFGGDPASITLVGMSAGAASVNYHVVSPMSQGLFQKAIAQSGSALNPWTLQYKPRKLFEKFVAFCECSRSTSAQTISCLREKSVEEILQAQNKCFESTPEFNSLGMQFVPTIETSEKSNDNLIAQPRFITEHPYVSMKNGKMFNKVPYMTGFTNNEGAFDTALINRETIQKLNDEWDRVAPYMLYLSDVTDPLDLHHVTRAIRQHYFGNGNITWDNKQIIADIISTRCNIHGILDTAILLSSHQPVYPYIMNYEGRHSGIQFLFKGVMDKNKVAHGDELLYMFNRTNGYPECELDSDDGVFSEKYIKLLVSFAKDGKPSATWNSIGDWDPISPNLTSITDDNLQVYRINLTQSQMVNYSTTDRGFWRSLQLDENEFYTRNKYQNRIEL